MKLRDLRMLVKEEIVRIVEARSMDTRWTDVAPKIVGLFQHSPAVTVQDVVREVLADSELTPSDVEEMLYDHDDLVFVLRNSGLKRQDERDHVYDLAMDALKAYERGIK